MEWFGEWWSGLELAEQILYCIAIPATLLLIIQTIMVLVGFGHGGEGINLSDTSGIDGLDSVDIDGGGADFSDISDVADTNGDGSNPSDYGSFSLFTFQGVVAFLTVFGWSGAISVGAGVPIWAAILIGFVLGFAAMAGVAKVIQLSSRLAQNGSLVMKNLLGLTGTVYLNIPANGIGGGKVTIQMEERFVECDAITDENTPIANNTPVRVVDIRAGNVIVVERI